MAGRGSQPIETREPQNQDPASKVLTLLDEGQSALGEQAWGKAHDAFDRVLAVVPSSKIASAGRATAFDEHQHREAYDRLTTAVKAHRYDEIVHTISAIPSSSVY